MSSFKFSTTSALGFVSCLFLVWFDFLTLQHFFQLFGILAFLKKCRFLAPPINFQPNLHFTNHCRFRCDCQSESCSSTSPGCRSVWFRIFCHHWPTRLVLNINFYNGPQNRKININIINNIILYYGSVFVCFRFVFGLLFISPPTVFLTCFNKNRHAFSFQFTLVFKWFN